MNEMLHTSRTSTLELLELQELFFKSGHNELGSLYLEFYVF